MTVGTQQHFRARQLAAYAVCYYGYADNMRDAIVLLVQRGVITEEQCLAAADQITRREQWQTRPESDPAS